MVVVTELTDGFHMSSALTTEATVNAAVGFSFLEAVAALLMKTESEQQDAG